MENNNSDPTYSGLLKLFRERFPNINLARIKMLALLVLALVKVKTVNCDRLASGIDLNCCKKSAYRRIQRFMRFENLCINTIARIIFSFIPSEAWKNGKLQLVIDRSNWKYGKANINIFMLGIAYRNIAIPLMFTFLDKKGCSDTQERKDLLERYIELFGINTIDCLLADREFVGAEWLEYLNMNEIRYYIRIRKDFKIYSYKHNQEVKAFHLFNHLKVGEFSHYGNIMRIHGKKGEQCYLSGCRLIDEKGKITFLIIVSFNKPEQAQANYKERWQIETMFRGLKSSGFNLEDTHMTLTPRLKNLLATTLLAFIWCYKVGQYLDSGPGRLCPIKIKTHGRREISVFKHGVDYLSKSLINKNNIFNINLLQILSCT